MRLGQKAFAEVFRAVSPLFQLVGTDGIPKWIDARFGLLAAESWLELPDDVEPSGSAVLEILESRPYFGLHRHGRKQIGSVPHHHAVKTDRSDSEDGQGTAIDQKALVHDRRVRAEAALPITEAQDHDRVRTGHQVIRGNQNTARRRLYPQHVEIVARDQLA